MLADGAYDTAVNQNLQSRASVCCFVTESGATVIVTLAGAIAMIIRRL